MNTERSLNVVPRQEHLFNPDEHEHPVAALAAEIRSLKLGERVRLPDDQLIISRTVMVGASQARRFSVVPAVGGSSAVERHRVVALGHGACKTAEQAAAKALSRGE